MSSDVVNLLARREARQETVLHFNTAVEALDFAANQVRDLQTQAGTALLLNAKDLELPLAQAAAVIRACRDLCANPNTKLCDDHPDERQETP